MMSGFFWVLTSILKASSIAQDTPWRPFEERNGAVVSINVDMVVLEVSPMITEADFQPNFST
jgi:hypothetical protein